MSEGIPNLDIVLLALIAGFVLLRLRSVLGHKMGNENPNYFKKKTDSAARRDDPVVQFPLRGRRDKLHDEEAALDPALENLSDSALRDAFTDIKAKDADFSLTSFLQGAKSAFEMVFDAFNRSDRDALRMLLSEPLYTQFQSELDQRANLENKPETTLVAVGSHEVTSASLSGNVARIGVRFASEQIAVTRNSSGEIVEGDPSGVENVEDQWVFERDLTSRNPNWKIMET